MDETWQHFGKATFAPTRRHTTDTASDPDLIAAVQRGADPAEIAKAVQDGSYARARGHSEDDTLADKIEEFLARRDEVNAFRLDRVDTQDEVSDGVREALLSSFGGMIHSMLDRIYQEGVQSGSRLELAPSFYEDEAIELLNKVSPRLETLEAQLKDEQRVRKLLEGVLSDFMVRWGTPRGSMAPQEAYRFSVPTEQIQRVVSALFEAERLDNPNADYEEMGG